jgi:hypothetical protein
MDSEHNSVRNADTDALALLGKKQVLKRRFGFLSIFGFAMCELYVGNSSRNLLTGPQQWWPCRSRLRIPHSMAFYSLGLYRDF